MILHADKVGMLGGSKFISGIVSSVDWPENITDQFGKMSGQSHTGTNLIPDPYGFVRIRFQINRFLFFRKSMQILFTDRALPTIRRMDKILGKISPSPYSPKITVAYGEFFFTRLFRYLDSALH